MKLALIVARKEFVDGIRNRWVMATSIVFGLFAVGLAYFGASASGIVGFTSLATTIISLASLVIFLIPLIALVLAYDSIIGEEEQGTLLLLMTYPIKPTQLLAGKFMGHAGIMAISTFFGFGFAAILIAAMSGEIFEPKLWGAFSYFLLTATLLGWVFVAMAYVASVIVREKNRAAGFSLILWIWFVVVFDLILLGILVLNQNNTSNYWLPYLLLLNPTDVFRLANMAGFEEARNYSGLTYMTTGFIFRPTALTGILVLWVIVPLWFALWVFNRRQNSA